MRHGRRTDDDDDDVEDDVEDASDVNVLNALSSTRKHDADTAVEDGKSEDASFTG